VLWALALESLDEENRAELERLVAAGDATPTVFAKIRRLFQRAGVFEKAFQLVREHQAQAERVAEALAPQSLRLLAYHLIETVLEQPAANGRSGRRLAVPAR
jgi:hypothetical protein